MSASPAASAAAGFASQKRPLEDPSSEAGVSDQPEAKRLAMRTIKTAIKAAIEDGDNFSHTATAGLAHEGVVEDDVKVKIELDAEQTNGQPSAEGNAILETQPIQSTTSHNNNSAATQGNFQPHHHDETGWLHVRAIISSAEAATIIGKGGENVSLIRRMSGAKCTVSDYSRGAVERILTVSGLVDATAKAFGLIIRTLNNEPLDTPSTTQSKTYPLRLLVPHVLVGSIIGQKGTRIREIQEHSGARLNASESCLPLSTERSLVVLGVADAVHIATYYVGSTLMEQLTERFGGPSASAYATRAGLPVGIVPGGMQVVPYIPQPAGGQWGPPDTYRRHPTQQSQQRGGQNNYGGQYNQAPSAPQQGGMQYGGAPARNQAYAGASASPYGATPQQGMPQQAMGGVGGVAMPGQPLTQQIYIPNDMVGAIIGKGGAKINEIRQLSGSVIKINEPQDNSNERLVTITGTQDCNQMALYMLYQRLGKESLVVAQP